MYNFTNIPWNKDPNPSNSRIKLINWNGDLETWFLIYNTVFGDTDIRLIQTALTKFSKLKVLQYFTVSPTTLKIICFLQSYFYKMRVCLSFAIFGVKRKLSRGSGRIGRYWSIYLWSVQQFVYTFPTIPAFIFQAFVSVLTI